MTTEIKDLIKVGAVLKMRNGLKCTVVYISDKPIDYPVHVELKGSHGNWEIQMLNLNGLCFVDTVNGYDIIGPWVEPRREFAKDERVFVRNSEKNIWEPRHFSHYSEEGMCVCFAFGRTSWTTVSNAVENWKFIKGADE